MCYHLKCSLWCFCLGLLEIWINLSKKTRAFACALSFPLQLIIACHVAQGSLRTGLKLREMIRFEFVIVNWLIIVIIRPTDWFESERSGYECVCCYLWVRTISYWCLISSGQSSVVMRINDGGDDDLNCFIIHTRQ